MRGKAENLHPRAYLVQRRSHKPWQSTTGRDPQRRSAHHRLCCTSPSLDGHAVRGMVRHATGLQRGASAAPPWHARQVPQGPSLTARWRRSSEALTPVSHAGLAHAPAERGLHSARVVDGRAEGVARAGHVSRVAALSEHPHLRQSRDSRPIKGGGSDEAHMRGSDGNA
jgi:hypothetical protein